MTLHFKAPYIKTNKAVTCVPDTFTHSLRLPPPRSHAVNPAGEQGVPSSLAKLHLVKKSQVYLRDF